jgi:hypothetical protein
VNNEKHTKLGCRCTYANGLRTHTHTHTHARTHTHTHMRMETITHHMLVRIITHRMLLKIKTLLHELAYYCRACFLCCYCMLSKKLPCARVFWLQESLSMKPKRLGKWERATRDVLRGRALGFLRPSNPLRVFCARVGTPPFVRGACYEFLFELSKQTFAFLRLCNIDCSHSVFHHTWNALG